MHIVYATRPHVPHYNVHLGHNVHVWGELNLLPQFSRLGTQVSILFVLYGCGLLGLGLLPFSSSSVINLATIHMHFHVYDSMFREANNVLRFVSEQMRRISMGEDEMEAGRQALWLLRDEGIDIRVTQQVNSTISLVPRLSLLHKSAQYDL